MANEDLQGLLRRASETTGVDIGAMNQRNAMIALLSALIPLAGEVRALRKLKRSRDHIDRLYADLRPIERQVHEDALLVSMRALVVRVSEEYGPTGAEGASALLDLTTDSLEAERRARDAK